MRLDVEDEFAPCKSLRGGGRLERRFLRQHETAAGCAGGGERVLIGQQRGRGAAQTRQEPAARDVGAPRIVSDPLDRERAGGVELRANGEPAEITVAGGIDLDREPVGHGGLLVF